MGAKHFCANHKILEDSWILSNKKPKCIYQLIDQVKMCCYSLREQRWRQLMTVQHFHILYVFDTYLSLQYIPLHLLTVYVNKEYSQTFALFVLRSNYKYKVLFESKVLQVSPRRWSINFKSFVLSTFFSSDQ